MAHWANSLLFYFLVFRCFLIVISTPGPKNKIKNKASIPYNLPASTKSFQVKDFDHYNEEHFDGVADYDFDEEFFDSQGSVLKHNDSGDKKNKGRESSSQPPVGVSKEAKDDKLFGQALKAALAKEDFLMQTTNISTIDEFLKFFNVTDSSESGIQKVRPAFIPKEGNYNTSQELDDSEEVSGMEAINAVALTALPQAMCQVDVVVVELERPNEVDVIQFPTCVRLRRCGGCSTSELVQCEPMVVTNITIKVIQIKYTFENSKPTSEAEEKSIIVQQHESCGLACRIKEKDCNRWQEYNADSCRCECTNTEVMKACQGDNKMWDPRECRCVCRHQAECSTGSFFDAETCRCTALTVRSSSSGSTLKPSRTSTPQRKTSNKDRPSLTTPSPWIHSSQPEAVIVTHGLGVVSYDDADYPFFDDLDEEDELVVRPLKKPKVNKKKKKQKKKQRPKHTSDDYLDEFMF